VSNLDFLVLAEACDFLAQDWFPFVYKLKENARWALFRFSWDMGI